MSFYFSLNVFSPLLSIDLLPMTYSAYSYFVIVQIFNLKICWFNLFNLKSKYLPGMDYVLGTDGFILPCLQLCLIFCQFLSPIMPLIYTPIICCVIFPNCSPKKKLVSATEVVNFGSKVILSLWTCFILSTYTTAPLSPQGFKNWINSQHLRIANFYQKKKNPNFCQPLKKPRERFWHLAFFSW